jgi:hypothetical protein
MHTCISSTKKLCNMKSLLNRDIGSDLHNAQIGSAASHHSQLQCVFSIPVFPVIFQKSSLQINSITLTPHAHLILMGFRLFTYNRSGIKLTFHFGLSITHTVTQSTLGHQFTIAQTGFICLICKQTFTY